MKNVPHEEWLALLGKSERLQAEASYLRRTGKHDAADAIWSELTPLNCYIRRLAVLPTTLVRSPPLPRYTRR